MKKKNFEVENYTFGSWGKYFWYLGKKWLLGQYIRVGIRGK